MSGYFGTETQQRLQARAEASVDLINATAGACKIHLIGRVAAILAIQEHQVERTDIFITASGQQNSAGDELSGADAEAGNATSSPRADAPPNGAIAVSVDVNDADKIDAVRETFVEFRAE